MPNIIPKSSTWIVVLAGITICTVAAALFGSSFVAVWEHRTGFKIGLIAGLIALAVTAIYWLISLKDPVYEEKSGRMWFFVLAFAFCFIWICAWSSQYKADKEDHIEYNGK